MTSPGCPYCQQRLRRRHEPTCGIASCIDRHVQKQAAIAELTECQAHSFEDNTILTRGYRCDRCGHEQEADVACDACGNQGVVPFGFPPPKAPRFRCGACGHQQDTDDAGCEKCGSFDVSERASAKPPRPSSVVGAVAASVGMDEATVRLVFALEQQLRGHDSERQRSALGVALWRTMNQHPTLASSVDLYLQRITLREGGRVLSVELDALGVEPDRATRGLGRP